MPNKPTRQPSPPTHPASGWKHMANYAHMQRAITRDAKQSAGASTRFGSATAITEARTVVSTICSIGGSISRSAIQYSCETVAARSGTGSGTGTGEDAEAIDGTASRYRSATEATGCAPGGSKTGYAPAHIFTVCSADAGGSLTTTGLVSYAGESTG